MVPFAVPRLRDEAGPLPKHNMAYFGQGMRYCLKYCINRES
jgi:hypothetical protein